MSTIISEKQAVGTFIERYAKTSHRELEVSDKLYKKLESNSPDSLFLLEKALKEYFRCTPSEERAILTSFENLNFFNKLGGVIAPKNCHFVQSTIPLPKYNSGNFYISSIEL
jgi:hypothetical protein